MVASAASATLADELEQVLKKAQSGSRAKWYERAGWVRFSKIDDRADALLSALVASFTAILCFIDIGAAQRTQTKEFSAVNSAFLVAFAVLSAVLAHHLHTFTQQQRVRAVDHVIGRLRSLDEDSGEIYKHLPKDISHLFTTTKRRGKWRNVPNNLLVVGDIVALQSGKMVPADVKRIADGRVTFRDEHLGPPLAHTGGNSSLEPGLEFLELIDIELYTVEKSPLVTDIALFLSSSERAEQSEIGNQFYAAALYLRIVAIIGSLLFGTALGAARLVVRPDGYDFVDLIFLRAATLLCLLPSLSWSWFRIAFERYWVRKMHLFIKAHGEIGPWKFMPLSPSTVVRLIGSVTALCGLDEDTLLYDAPAVEELFLLKGGKKTQVIDSCLDASGPTGLRFEDPQWKNHLSSLKPIGLVCGLASAPLPMQPIPKPQLGALDEEKTSLIEIFQERVIPTHFGQLASTMGFRSEDFQGINVRARCTIIAGSVPGDPSAFLLTTPSSTRLAASSFHGKPIVECVVMEVVTDGPTPGASGPAGMNIAPHAPISVGSGLSLLPSAAPLTSGTPEPVGSPGSSKTSTFQQSTVTSKSGGKDDSRSSGTQAMVGSVSSLAAGSTSMNSTPGVTGGGSLPIQSKSSLRNILSPQPQQPQRAPTPSVTPPVQVPTPPASFPFQTSIHPNMPSSKLGIGSTSTLSLTSTTTPTSTFPPSSTSALHLVCWGHASLLMQYCTEYWDGESIWSLDMENRKQVQKMSMQWEKEDFDYVGFCYGPLSTPTIQDKAAFLNPSQVPVPDDAFVVYRSGMTATTAAQSGIARPTTPPVDKNALRSSVPLERPSSSGHPVNSALFSPAPSSSTAAALSPAEIQERRIQVICSNLMRGEIFTGMVGSRDQTLSEINYLVEHLHRGGVRFVYFSPRDAKKGRKIAEKMGLETDWNTSISLAKPQQDRFLADSQHGPSPLQSPSVSSTTLHHHPQSGGEGGGGGTSYSNLYADWELKARMPKGIEAIKCHIVEVDDVPLRVSVFTDCVPGTIGEMVEVMQDHGEVVAVFGCPLAGMNSRACTIANVSVAVVPDVIPQANNDELKLSMDCGRLSCSFAFRESASGVLMGLLGEGRVALYNYRQANQCFIALSLIGFVCQCVLLCASAPEMFTLGHVLWLVWVQIPLLSCAPALRPRHRQTMLWERMPWKKRAMPESNQAPRFTLYAMVRLLPVCAFICGMFFWALIDFDPSAASKLGWASIGNSSSTEFNAEAVQAAQSIALLAFVWCGSFVSASFASRTETERHLELWFWLYWLVFTLVCLGLQLVYNCILAQIVVGDCAVAFPSGSSGYFSISNIDAVKASILWAVLFLAPPIFIPLVAYPVKKHDRIYYQRAMQMLRLDFETKLGQFSPK